MHQHSHSDCIAACQRCHDICLQTIHHCLRQGGAHADQPHVRLMADCVEICQTSANFMLRGSDLHQHTCSACAEVCERCAADCERLAGDDEQMRACAEACRACARSCREMSGHGVIESADSHESYGETNGSVAAGQTWNEQVAEIAERLFEEAGRPTGQDQEFWYRAENELRERAGRPVQDDLLASAR